MREHTFDAFTRRATVAVTRRGSLLALGGAALATGLGSPTRLAAKDKKAKKAKKKATKAKKKFAAQCEEQKSLCQTAVLGVPGGAALIGCCAASCFSGDFIDLPRSQLRRSLLAGSPGGRPSACRRARLLVIARQTILGSLAAACATA